MEGRAIQSCRTFDVFRVHFRNLREYRRLVGVAAGRERRGRRRYQHSARESALHEIASAQTLCFVSHESLPSLLLYAPISDLNDAGLDDPGLVGAIFRKAQGFEAACFGLAQFLLRADLIHDIERGFCGGRQIGVARVAAE